MVSKNKIFLGGAVVVLLLFCAGMFFLYKHAVTAPVQEANVDKTPAAPASMDVTVLVPDNIGAYDKAMEQYTQNGGKNPAATWKFVKTTATGPAESDVMQASARAAAQALPLASSPTAATASLISFAVRDHTAYVMLDIDQNARATNLIDRNRIHPVVEKTLLQFKEITKVVFDYVPEQNLTICSDKCGDGICQQFDLHCDSGYLNCICPETHQNCPKDCK